MKATILVVEDEEALRMALSDRLQREGYVVECASDGESAFEKATSVHFETRFCLTNQTAPLA